MSLLEAVIQHGTTTYVNGHIIRRVADTHIVCKDGFTASIIAGWGVYCSPRPGGLYSNDVSEEYAGPYTHVEVGYPSERPEPWDVWEEFCESPERPTETVYGYVPVDVVQDLITLHGGEQA